MNIVVVSDIAVEKILIIMKVRTIKRQVVSGNDGVKIMLILSFNERKSKERDKTFNKLQESLHFLFLHTGSQYFHTNYTIHAVMLHVFRDLVEFICDT